jgi:hypothetical protein
VAQRHRHNEWLKFLKKLDSDITEDVRRRLGSVRSTINRPNGFIGSIEFLSFYLRVGIEKLSAAGQNSLRISLKRSPGNASCTIDGAKPKVSVAIP